jgi:hypothetical protein
MIAKEMFRRLLRENNITRSLRILVNYKLNSPLLERHMKRNEYTITGIEILLMGNRISVQSEGC